MSVIVEVYKDLMSRGDPRTVNWFLISSPFPLLGIISAYLYFCISLGPRLMANRKPFTLRKTLIVYNFIQVLLSAYMVYEGLMAGWLYDYSFGCQPVDYSDNPQALRMARGCYIYFSCKVIELLDTIFFVMRKKDRQISFLHLYHHAMMPICGWIGTRYVPGGHPTLLGVINSFIHILMYAYYMLSAFGPEVQKYLWWKKHITSMQLVQFVIILVHNVQIQFRDCNFPKPLSRLLILNAGLFIYLFGSFYVKTYNSKGKTDKVTSSKTNGEIANGSAKTNGYTNGSLSNGHTKSNKSE